MKTKLFNIFRAAAIAFAIAATALLFVNEASAQEYQYAYVVDIASASSPVTVPTDGHITLVQIKGTKSLGANYTISASSSPLHEAMVKFIFDATVTLNGNDFIVFGTTVPEEMIDQELVILAIYIDSAWEVYMLLDHATASNWINIDDIDPTLVDDATVEIDPVNGIQVKDAGVTEAKLANWTAGQLLVSDAGGAPTAVTISGDVAVSDAGAVTIANSAVETAMIADENVTWAKVEDLARGSVLIGGASDRPTEVDASSSGYVLVGDGTDVNAVAISGDVTIDAAGAITIANNAVETSMISDANVTLDKLENISSGYVLMGNGSSRPTATAVSGDVAISATGAVTIQSSAVEASMIADGAVTPAKMAPETGGGETAGILAVKYVDAATFKSLLDGTENELFDLQSGEVVAFVQIAVQTAAGTAGTIDVGCDDAILAAGKDLDAFIIDADGNSTGLYNTVNTTYRGAQMDFGYFTADALGKILIQSSANLSSSSIVATASIYYVPNN